MAKITAPASAAQSMPSSTLLTVRNSSASDFFMFQLSASRFGTRCDPESPTTPLKINRLETAMPSTLEKYLEAIPTAKFHSFRLYASSSGSLGADLVNFGHGRLVIRAPHLDIFFCRKADVRGSRIQRLHISQLRSRQPEPFSRRLKLLAMSILPGSNLALNARSGGWVGPRRLLSPHEHSRAEGRLTLR